MFGSRDANIDSKSSLILDNNEEGPTMVFMPARNQSGVEGMVDSDDLE